MLKDLKMLLESQSLPCKLKLFSNISLNKIESVDIDNSVKGLPFDLEEIKRIQKLDYPHFLKFLYINKDIIQDILYNNEGYFKIDFEKKDIDLSYYLYLCFLIEESELIFYKYPFELISNLNEIQRNENKKFLKNIIVSKIILALVDYFNQIDDNEDNENNKHKEELGKIYDFNSKILDDKDNKQNLNQYGLKLEDLRSKKIEEIYIIIIKYLIENSKLEDSEFIENIINQIELESIIVTKLMLEELIKILAKEKEYIKKYKIKNFDDLFDKKKVNFYYNLLKYILKQSLYIYQFPFLFEARAKILDLIKNNLGELSPSLKKSDFKLQIEYILKQFIGDSSYKYYYQESESIMNNKYERNSYDLSSCGPFSNDSYKSEKETFINLDNDFEYGDFNKNELVYKILNKSKFILHNNKKGRAPFIIYDEIKIIVDEEETENKTIEEIRKTSIIDERLINNYKKFLSFLDKFETALSNEFINNYKIKITLDFETQSINNNNDFNITCYYEIEMPGENPEQFKDNNILTNGIGEGFQYMLNEINYSNYLDIEYS